ncbi:MAG: hypothetical protein GY832_11185 [Chloroflexi bacterium]|nr:hypothetical protein [Chloroflexota bacterium]
MNGIPLPGYTDIEMPDCFVWYLTVEKHGFVCQGAYLDQPAHFMRDIEAAEVGKRRFDRNQEANANVGQTQQVPGAFQFPQWIP